MAELDQSVEIRHLNENFKARSEQLFEWMKYETPLQNEVNALYHAFLKPYESPKQLLNLLHRTQRVSAIFHAGAQKDEALLASLAETTSPLWEDAQEIPVAPDLQKRLATQLLASPLPFPNPDSRVLLTPYAPTVGEAVVEGLVHKVQNFDVEFSDGDWYKRLVEGISEQAAQRLGEAEGAHALKTEKHYKVCAYTEDFKTVMPDDKKAAYEGKWKKQLHHKRVSSDNFYNLTYIPTPEDAAIDGMEYEPYLQLFFELCDQPWEAVEEAQAQLIDEFDAAKELRIQNDDGTDLVLDIEGQTFANSVIKKNVPGSEIFSSPKREGVNGTWVANGKFLADGHEEPIENMRFRFENGKVVEAHAEKNNEALQEVLGRDEGARYCGEIGIGTNPWLKQHVMNGLLVEKVGGTFHLALGACYNYETYDGKPVNVKNGNKSGIHWDITTMLKGRGGKMYLDGKLIQEDGLFLAPQYRVFNEGWAALPAKEQPGHWQKRLAEKAAEQTAQKLR